MGQPQLHAVRVEEEVGVVAVALVGLIGRAAFDNKFS
jgi:hypothetical protein